MFHRYYPRPALLSMRFERLTRYVPAPRPAAAALLLLLLGRSPPKLRGHPLEGGAAVNAQSQADALPWTCGVKSVAVDKSKHDYSSSYYKTRLPDGL